MKETRKRTGAPKYGTLILESLPKGYVIDERYEIVRKLGQGGFGAVYLSHDLEMGIDKALKILPEAFSHDEEAMVDLRSEAKTMVSLNHTNIIRVYDFHSKGEIKYIDMEYVDGKTLTGLKLEYPDKRMPEEKVRELAIQISEGIAYAHDKGVIHKDIKPQNVMVNGDDQVKIMDFGIAETLRVSMSRIDNTSTSGTLVYMSPEQIKGKDVGKESDIYSFGTMLYELLSGHPPFYKGDISYQIVNEEPSEIKDISTEMNDLLQNCLKKDYNERIHNINDVVELLGGERSVYIGSKKQSQKVIHAQDPKKKIQKKVDLLITTVPSEAKVWLDGKQQKGVTPISTGYKIGRCKITIKKEYYDTIKEEIEISENGRNEFTVELDSLFGSISVFSDEPNQVITMNGSSTSEIAPFTFIDLKPDVYIISVDGQSRYSDPIKVILNSREHLDIELVTKPFCTLLISTKYRAVNFIVSGQKVIPGENVLLPPANYTIIPSLDYLPDVKLQLKENENKVVDYDEIIDKRSFHIDTGNFDVDILIRHNQTGQVINTTITGERTFQVLPGTLEVVIQWGEFEKTYEIDLTKQYGLLDIELEISDWLAKNGLKKSEGGPIGLLKGFAIILLFLYVISYC